ncbi:MAG: Txe/YoeB family addiction module toxin [Dehalococcoidia bacterium]|nr:Txe/YoeB family addiction module toxin [Dehalococcoidia bacterium]
MTADVPSGGRHDPSRDTVFQPEFREDLTFWITTDRNVALRVLRLVDAILRDPFVGIGKPEPLRRFGPNTWSRRVTSADRIIYVVLQERIDFVSARGHY